MPDSEFHRYGRHGPRAWLRWRNHRWRKSLSLPTPETPETRTVIIYVHIPVVLAERMVIVLDPDEHLKEVEGSLETPAISDKFDGLRENMRTYGEQDGEKQAKLDMESLNPHIFVGEDLHEKAKLEAQNTIRKQDIGSFPYREAEPIYIEAYCDAYKRGVAPIEDDDTKSVWGIVLQEANKHQTFLPDFTHDDPQKADIRIILQIISILGMGNPRDTAYVEEVWRLKEVYGKLQARVQTLKKKGGGPPAPSTFPQNPFRH